MYTQINVAVPERVYCINRRGRDGKILRNKLKLTGCVLPLTYSIIVGGASISPR